MAKPFHVPDETPSGAARRRNSSTTTSTATSMTTSTAANNSTGQVTAVASTSQPQSPTSAVPAAAGLLPQAGALPLNSEYLMLAFVEALERYYRDAQGGLLGYFNSAPPSPSYYRNDEVFSCDDLQNSRTDRFYGTPKTVQRSRSNSFPTIRAQLLSTRSRSRDVNNNNVVVESSDDDESESIPRQFAMDLQARECMQEFSGCIPKRKKRKLSEHHPEILEIPQHEQLTRDDNTRDDDDQPKEKKLALSFILVSALAIGFGLFAARKI